MTITNSKKTAVGYEPSLPPPTLPTMTATLYRLLVRVPLSYVQEVRKQYGENGQKMLLKDIRSRIENMGWNKTLLATQDPTDNSLFTVLGRPGSSPTTQDNVIRILSTEPVEEPPEKPREKAPILDSGMTQEEANTVKQAFLTDQNPRHLCGLAQTLDPWFPISACLLYAKADLIERRVHMDEKGCLALLELVYAPVDREVEIAPRRQAFEAYAQASPVPLEILRDEVKRAAMTLACDPDSSLEKFPKPVGDLARSLPINIASGVVPKICPATMEAQESLYVIAPRMMRAALPPNPQRDGFISPSALQLALATYKPEWSRVNDKREIGNVFEALSEKPRSPTEARDLHKANSQMERAKKAIERQRWIAWYRRVAEIKEDCV